MSSPAYTGADLLLLLAPPLALVDYLERLWATMASNGKEIPPAYVRWLERWQRIRADGLSDVDYVLADEGASGCQSRTRAYTRLTGNQYGRTS